MDPTREIFMVMFFFLTFSNFHKANLETSNVRNWVLWDDPLGLESENSVRLKRNVPRPSKYPKND